MPNIALPPWGWTPYAGGVGDEASLMGLVGAIAHGDHAHVSRLHVAALGLATARVAAGGTGRGGSGSLDAREQQQEIIRLLQGASAESSPVGGG